MLLAMFFCYIRGGSTHECEDSKSILGHINLHDASFFHPTNISTAAIIISTLEYNKVNNKTSTFLFVGSSITAMGYFNGFVNRLSSRGYKIRVVNHGHGATDIFYGLYCIDYGPHKPDIIFADLRHSDWEEGKKPQYSEALFRKLYLMTNNVGQSSLLVHVGFSHINDDCPRPTKYWDIRKHYSIPSIELCDAVKYCFGNNSYANWSKYSEDWIHPTTKLAHQFITDLMFEWWLEFVKHVHSVSGKYIIVNANATRTKHHAASVGVNSNTHVDVLYNTSGSVVSTNNICATCASDSTVSLVPAHKHPPPRGFSIVTRTKQGVMGFQNIKRAWEGKVVGSRITFPFSGPSLFVAVYQKNAGMGVMDVFLDSESIPRTNITGYFEGYSWAGTGVGRQFIVPVFDDLLNTKHTVTFVISTRVASLSQPGHQCQVIALLYDNIQTI